MSSSRLAATRNRNSIDETVPFRRLPELWRIEGPVALALRPLKRKGKMATGHAADGRKQ